MVHIHLIWFWWKPPRISDEATTDLAELVRWLGKGYFLKRIKNSANEIVASQHILLSPPDWSAIDRENRSLVASLWRATFPIERWLVLAFTLFGAFATIYVGDAMVGLYMLGAMFVWWGIYFGSLALAIERCSRWLDAIVAQHVTMSREPTEESCQRIINKWRANLTSDSL